MNQTHKPYSGCQLFFLGLLGAVCPTPSLSAPSHLRDCSSCFSLLVTKLLCSTPQDLFSPIRRPPVKILWPTRPPPLASHQMRLYLWSPHLVYTNILSLLDHCAMFSLCFQESPSRFPFPLPHVASSASTLAPFCS